MKRFAPFLRDEYGAVATEAVIILPILLFFYAGSFVFFDAFRSYNVTIKGAYTVGDILSRQTSTVTSDDINGLRDLYAFLTFDDPADTVVRVTQVRRTAGGYARDWSHATAGGTALTDADIAPIAFKLPEMSTGERIMVVETFSGYVPAFNVGITAHIWENFVVTRPRFASSLPFQDLGS